MGHFYSSCPTGLCETSRWKQAIYLGDDTGLAIDKNDSRIYYWGGYDSIIYGQFIIDRTIRGVLNAPIKTIQQNIPINLGHDDFSRIEIIKSYPDDPGEGFDASPLITYYFNDIDYSTYSSGITIIGTGYNSELYVDVVPVSGTQCIKSTTMDTLFHYNIKNIIIESGGSNYGNINIVCPIDLRGLSGKINTNIVDGSLDSFTIIDSGIYDSIPRLSVVGDGTGASIQVVWQAEPIYTTVSDRGKYTNKFLDLYVKDKNNHIEFKKIPDIWTYFENDPPINYYHILKEICGWNIINSGSNYTSSAQNPLKMRVYPIDIFDGEEYGPNSSKIIDLDLILLSSNIAYLDYAPVSFAKFPTSLNYYGYETSIEYNPEIHFFYDVPASNGLQIDYEYSRGLDVTIVPYPDPIETINLTFTISSNSNDYITEPIIEASSVFPEEYAQILDSRSWKSIAAVVDSFVMGPYTASGLYGQGLLLTGLDNEGNLYEWGASRTRALKYPVRMSRALYPGRTPPEPPISPVYRNIPDLFKSQYHELCLYNSPADGTLIDYTVVPPEYTIGEFTENSDHVDMITNLKESLIPSLDIWGNPPVSPPKIPVEPDKETNMTADFLWSINNIIFFLNNNNVYSINQFKFPLSHLTEYYPVFQIANSVTATFDFCSFHETKTFNMLFIGAAYNYGGINLTKILTYDIEFGEPFNPDITQCTTEVKFKFNDLPENTLPFPTDIPGIFLEEYSLITTCEPKAAPTLDGKWPPYFRGCIDYMNGRRWNPGGLATVAGITGAENGISATLALVEIGFYLEPTIRREDLPLSYMDLIVSGISIDKTNGLYYLSDNQLVNSFSNFSQILDSAYEYIYDLNHINLGVIAKDGSSYSAMGGTNIKVDPISRDGVKNLNMPGIPQLTIGQPNRATNAKIVIDGKVNAIAIEKHGFGFTRPPIVHINGLIDNGGHQASGEAVIEILVKDIEIIDGGSNYAVPPTIHFHGVGYPPLISNIILNNSGGIKSINITHPGRYRNMPSISFSNEIFIDNNGRSAYLKPLTSSKVLYIDIKDSGNMYQYPPDIVIENEDDDNTYNKLMSGELTRKEYDELPQTCVAQTRISGNSIATYYTDNLVGVTSTYVPGPYGFTNADQFAYQLVPMIVDGCNYDYDFFGVGIRTGVRVSPSAGRSPATNSYSTTCYYTDIETLENFEKTSTSTGPSYTVVDLPVSGAPVGPPGPYAMFPEAIVSNKGLSVSCSRLKNLRATALFRDPSREFGRPYRGPDNFFGSSEDKSRHMTKILKDNLRLGLIDSFSVDGQFMSTIGFNSNDQDQDQDSDRLVFNKKSEYRKYLFYDTINIPFYLNDKLFYLHDIKWSGIPSIQIFDCAGSGAILSGIMNTENAIDKIIFTSSGNNNYTDESIIAIDGDILFDQAIITGIINVNNKSGIENIIINYEGYGYFPDDIDINIDHNTGSGLMIKVHTYDSAIPTGVAGISILNSGSNYTTFPIITLTNKSQNYHKKLMHSINLGLRQYVGKFSKYNYDLTNLVSYDFYTIESLNNKYLSDDERLSFMDFQSHPYAITENIDHSARYQEIDYYDDLDFSHTHMIDYNFAYRHDGIVDIVMRTDSTDPILYSTAPNIKVYTPFTNVPTASPISTIGYAFSGEIETTLITSTSELMDIQESFTDVITSGKFDGRIIRTSGASC